MSLAKAVQRAWYAPSPGWLYLLWPLEWLFRWLAGRRRDRTQAIDVGVPVVVVGNITAGGSGKTPLVLAIAADLQRRGFSPGIISRGYGGRAAHYPCRVDQQSQAAEVGDEPLLMALRSGIPVMVDPDRPRGAAQLVKDSGCDVIISDDGLQHYRLARQVEIAVIDGDRGLGNGHCLPVGPLREPVRRLNSVHLRVVNGNLEAAKKFDAALMTLVPGQMVSLHSSETRAINAWPELQRRVNAVAGIGHPQRFFATLTALGFDPEPRPFADHHAFTPADFAFNDLLPVIMTEKDAVKCRALNLQDAWYLPVTAQLAPTFFDQLAAYLR